MLSWKWSNVPIPEIHVAGLAAGVILHFVFPVGVFGSRLPGFIIGGPALVAGIFVASWAVQATGKMSIALPTNIIVEGPYASSRNPMYVGWTLICLGIGLAVNEVWILALLLPVVIYTHFIVIRHEEQSLERDLGEEYLRYRDRVRRYL